MAAFPLALTAGAETVAFTIVATHPQLTQGVRNMTKPILKVLTRSGIDTDQVVTGFDIFGVADLQG